MRERKRRERGITLIALVITIIIIIILSTITINLAFGDNGLIKMAEQARDEAANSTEYETETRANLVEYMNEFIAGMGGGESGGGTTEPEEPDEETVISAGEIQQNPGEYYGAELEGYECESNGVSTWRIFYADESNIYIIADDYIASEYAPTSTAGNSLNVGSTNYCLYFTNILNDYTGSSWIRSNTNSSAREWLSYVESYQTSTNNNIKAVAYLMDTNKWSSYAGSNAEYAIGGPTLELFCASYSDTHNPGLDCNSVTSTGYQIKFSTDSSYSYYLNGLTQDEYNSIYIKSDESKARGMWLASPSAYASNILFSAYYDGHVGSSNYGINHLGLRPLVCLKSSVQIERVDEDTFRIVT